MEYSNYITPKEYKIAESNGISKRMLEARIRVYNWDKEKAITYPKRMGKNWGKKFLKEAIKNGISAACFYSRLTKGVPIEIACTIPVGELHKRKDIPKSEKENIFNCYYKEAMSLEKIGKLYKVPTYAVRDFIIKFGGKIKPRGKNNL